MPKIHAISEDAKRRRLRNLIGVLGRRGAPLQSAAKRPKSSVRC